MTTRDRKPITASGSPEPLAGDITIVTGTRSSFITSAFPYVDTGLNLAPDAHLLPTTTWSSSGSSMDMKTDQPPPDQRVGDEITELDEKKEAHSPDPAGASSSGSDAVQEKREETPPPGRKFTLPSSLAWIPANSTWSHLKPVIRCALMAWVSIMFTILNEVAHPLGQVGVQHLVALTETDRCRD